MNKIKTMMLKKTHWEQLLWYAEIGRRYDVYYGNEKQFNKRDREIIDFLKKKIKESK